MSFSWFSHKCINVLNYILSTSENFSPPPLFPQVLSPPCIKDPRVEYFRWPCWMLKRFIWKRLRLLVWHWLLCKIAKKMLVVGENLHFHSRVTTNRISSSTRYIWLSYSWWKNIYWKFSADSGCTYRVRIFRHIDFTKMNQFICNKFTTFTATTTSNRFDDTESIVHRWKPWLK